MGLLSNVLTNPLGPVLAPVLGPAANDPLVFHAVTPDPLTFEIKGVLTGVGDLTEARVGSLNLPDHEQIWREFKTTIAAYFGGRVVENFLLQVEDFSNGVWTASETGGTVTVSGDNKSVTTAITAGSGRVYVSYTLAGLVVGHDYIIRIKSSNVSGSVTAKTLGVVTPAGSQISKIINGVITTSFTATATSTSFRFGFGINTTNTGNASITWTQPQLEDATGRTDTTTPSEYVATEAAAVQRVYGNENGNSVSSSVVTEAVGSELASPVWLVGQKALTNSQIRSFNLADAEWTKSNMTAVLNATGMRGDANGATTLTATAGNATCIANAITDASDDQTTRWSIKRLTGTGVINISVDSGSTWQDVTTEVDSTAGFNECLEDQAALANPQIGIRVVTDTDAVIVGNAEAHLGDLKEAVRQAGAIFTEGSTISTNATNLSFDDANHSDVQGGYFCEFRNAGVNGSPNQGGIIGLGITGRIIYIVSSGHVRTQEPGGDLVLGVSPKAFAADDAEYKFGVAYGDSLKRINADGTWSSAGAYSGAYTNTNNEIRILKTGNTANAPTATMLIRNIRRYNLGYVAAQAKIDELMA